MPRLRQKFIQVRCPLKEIWYMLVTHAELMETEPAQKNSAQCSYCSNSHNTCISTISTFAVSLSQTTPGNGQLVCPGEEFVLTCTTAGTGTLIWQISGEEDVLFRTNIDDVNANATRGQFTFLLTGKELNGAVLTSTATSQMANSSLDGLQIDCTNGLNMSTVCVDIAGMCACTFW